MRDDTAVENKPLPSGGLIQVQARGGDVGSWLGPGWAALCGVLASGAVPRQGEDWLRLALLLLLVDGGWGTLWAALSGANWALAIERWTEWEKNRALLTLPYTLPGTPGDRISRGLGRLVTWWQTAFWPACGTAVRGILIALPLAALLAALLGPELLLLSVAALALMQLGVIWEGGTGTLPTGWDGWVAVGLPWLAGHTAFGTATLSSAGLAVLFATAWGHAWDTTARGARGALIISQLSSVALFVMLRRPLAAGFVLLALLPQMALLPWLQLDLTTSRFVRHTRPWLMAAMVVAALAL